MAQILLKVPEPAIRMMDTIIAVTLPNLSLIIPMVKDPRSIPPRYRELNNDLKEQII